MHRLYTHETRVCFAAVANMLITIGIDDCRAFGELASLNSVLGIANDNASVLVQPLFDRFVALNAEVQIDVAQLHDVVVNVDAVSSSALMANAIRALRLPTIFMQKHHLARMRIPP